MEAGTKLVQIRYSHLRISHYSHPLMFIIFLCCILNLFMFSADQALGNNSSASEVSSSEKYMKEGLRSFEGGAFEEAILNWTEAAGLYEKEGKIDKQCKALIQLSQAYQSIGQYKKAIENLEYALILSEISGDLACMASALGSIGNVYLATGPADKAYRYLKESLDIARDLGYPNLSAIILNNLGNLYTSQEKYKEAIGFYMESITLSKGIGNYSLVASAHTNAGTASMRDGEYKQAKELFDIALDQSRVLDNSHSKAYGLIKIGMAYSDIRPHITGSNDSLLLLASKTFNEAAIVAKAIGDYRAESHAWGNLGKLYEEEHRYQEALQLTRRAIFTAQQINAPESLYQWQWQTGRLLKAMGKIDEAISAYRRAVYTIQSIRQEMSVSYGRTQSSFRKSMGPVYFELVDLLLQRAATMQEREQYEPYLIEVRKAIELLKVADLRDYFMDDCVDAAQSKITELDIVSQTAVVVYPILLPDRMELLVSLPSGLKRFAVPVGADTVTLEVRKFRRKIEKRTTREYMPHAQKLYDWLIRPLEPDLASLTIDTLVFVPEGPLLTIPMAALHDGKQFLINKYAIAITPSLTLTDPRPIKLKDNKILAVGITESVQGFPPLPNVSMELKAIESICGGVQLVNQDFLESNFEKELKVEGLSIVHIASHGQFRNDIKDTFLLTFDDKLTMNRLSQLVGLFQFREEPLELLILSACETAAGDDRAALGLAGVAVKAGARSAIATLWYINDQASSELIVEFYRQIQDPSISRSIALQHAQLKLLNDIRYEHPGYWSPFLLINNWL